MDSTILGWILVAGGGFLLLQRRKLLGNKTVDMIAGIALLLIGLTMTGVLSGLMSGSTAQSVANSGIAGVTLSSGIVNASGATTTDADFFSNGDDTVSFYLDDADLADDSTVNVTVTAVRKEVAQAQSFDITCTSPDFTKSGTVYNIVSKNTDSKLEGYVDGAGTMTTTGWTESVAFAEGDVSNAYVIQFKQDEAAEDILTTKESVNIACTIGGFPFNIVVIAND